ncbi:MFS transporter [Tsukamurella serpentis]
MEMSAARRWWILVVSMTAAITTTATVNSAAFLIPRLVHDGFSVQRAGLFAASAPAGLLLTTILWGALIDRYGERRILLISLTGAAVSLSGTVAAFASGAPLSVAAIGLFFASAMAASGNGASGRIVVGWFPATSRGTAMGIRQMSQPLGIALLSISMPTIAARTSLAAAMTVPLAVAVVSVVLVLLFIVDPPRPRTNPVASASDNPYRQDSFLVRVHVVSVLLQVPQNAVWTFGITWLIVGLQWAPTSAGFLVSGSQLLGALGRIAAGNWSDRAGSRTSPIGGISIAAAVSMAGLGLFAIVGLPAAAIVFFVIASTVVVADNGLAFTAIAERAGPFYSGRALGIQNTAQFAATVALTPVMAAAITATSFGTVFLVTALAPLIAYPLVPSDESNRQAAPS